MPTPSRWNVPIPDITLPTFLFGSANGPLSNTPLILDAEKPDRYHLTQSTYRLWAKRLAVGLKKAGLQPGDAVLLYTGNTFLFPVVVLGTIMAGGIFTGANPGYTAREVAYQTQNSGARFILCGEASLETGLEAAKQINLNTNQLFVFDEGYASFDGVGKGRNGIKHWTTLLASEKEAADYQWRDDKSLVNDTIALNYSSGTTGLPKGVEITHKNYVANCIQQTHLMDLRKNFQNEKDSYRWLCFLPMYHALAQTHFCVTAPWREVPVYIMRKYDFEKMLKSIQDFGITDLHAVPPIIVSMTKSPLVKKYDISSLKYANCGAAPLSADSCEQFASLWPKGHMNLKQGWGMTETTCSVLGWDPNLHSDSFSVGEPNANTEVMLVDPATEKEVKFGERGELWCRGANIMKSYWKNDKATKETLTSDGWLRSGDVAVQDENGMFYIVDRMKELIKVKGNQVAPAELEAQLLEHPSVQDVAVVGVQIQGDESPRAYVVLSPGQNAKPQEISKWMDSKVARHKRLTGGVKIVDAIAKNPSGKILRKEYREQAKKEVGDSAQQESRL